MAASAGNASDRRKAVAVIPAGSHTRCATSSWNGDAACPFRQEREDDKPAVVVPKHGARRITHRVSVQHRQKPVGRVEEMERLRHRIVGDRSEQVLVQVVADPRSVREQLLDGDVIVDQRQIAAEQPARGHVQGERAGFHQAHHRHGSEALAATGDRDPRRRRHRDREASVGQTVGRLENDAVAGVDTDDAGEPGVGGEPVKLAGQVQPVLSLLNRLTTCPLSPAAQDVGTTAPSGQIPRPDGFLPSLDRRRRLGRRLRSFVSGRGRPLSVGHNRPTVWGCGSSSRPAC